MSVQNLRMIFPEELTAKRVAKQIKLISQTAQIKNNVQIKYFFIKGELLNISVTLKNSYFNSIAPNKKPLEEIKMNFYYTSNYPYERPKLFINSGFLNQKYTVGCRDYMQQLCKGGWATNHQLLDLIKNILPFYLKVIELKHINSLGTYARGDFLFQEFYTQRSIQLYPIHIVVEEVKESAYLLIHRLDIIFIEKTSLDRYCRLVEVYPIDSIKSIHSGKTDPKQVMLILKWGVNQGGFEFRAEDAQKIIQSIIQKKKIFENEYKQLQKDRKKPAPVEISSNQNSIKYQPQNKASAHKYLQQLNESIIIIESLLQKEFNDAQVINLINLYKKAVEFCSANNVSNHNFYLKKLQQLMQRQETKALMNSMAPSKSIKINQSIFDAVGLNDK